MLALSSHAVPNMPPLHHLTGLDAAFLYLETPETPMHVGGLNIFELPLDFEGEFVDHLRAHIAQRMHLAPVFQRKLVHMPLELTNPIWVDEPDLDLEYHIRSTVLPKPGNRAQLDKLVGRLHSSLLDRSRPLWEFYVIEGLQPPPDATPGTRHVGFYSKVHHAAVDGEAGVALAHAIMDLDATPRAVSAPRKRRARASEEHLGMAALTTAGLKHSAVQTVKLAKALPALTRSVLRMLRPPTPRSARGSVAANTPATTWMAPKTPFNVSITNQRSFSSLSLPLDQARLVAKSHGVTLNDVVLAICSGALRRYLNDHGSLPTTPLLAAVPVSLRAEGNTDMNTQASMVRMSLASTIEDPIERLHAIHAASSSSKTASAGMKTAMPSDFPSLGTPWIISTAAALFGRTRVANRMPPLANLVISNVPGPKVALYMAGARMLTYYPVSIAVHSMALNITVQSYNGALDFGLIACRKAVPDLPVLADYMQRALRELVTLTPVPAAAPAPQASTLATPATPKAPRKPAVKAKATTSQPAAAPRKAKAAKKTAVAPLALVAAATAAPSKARAPRARKNA